MSALEKYNIMDTDLFTCSISLVFLFLVKTEECQIYDLSERHNQSSIFVPTGQPLATDCLLGNVLNLQQVKKNLTWYRSGEKMPITKNKHSRVHQKENVLWFMPATLEDTGSYECIVENVTSCNKIYLNINVFKTANGLCYNKKFSYTQYILKSSTASIVCPDLYYFRDKKNIWPVHWLKECNLFEDKRFLPQRDELIITNVSGKDAGSYLCQATYNYMGKQYNVSRNIYVTVVENPAKKNTEILYPRNNTIEVKLGSSLIIDCNVSSFKDYSIAISWKFNNSLVNYFFNKRIREEDQEDSFFADHMFSILRLNITEVKREDYGHHFVCRAGKVSAYIVLQRPARNIQGYLIGGFLSLVFLIVVAILIYKLLKIDIVLWYRKSCGPFLNKEDGKIYDAYVLYPKSSKVTCSCVTDSFVLRVLPEVLERQCGYTLFIFGRDDLPGKAVVNVVDETIKESRRLIIVLEPKTSSYNLLEDSPEEQLVLYNALIRDGIKVILIELAKTIDYTNMPESIKYIKQKHGAIQWEGDITQKSYLTSTRFWKKVRYRMPPRYSASSELPLRPVTLNTPFRQDKDEACHFNDSG
ncbi:interleukin-1 receptor-like 2 isoform X2 [Alligator sinensis]|uniref:Interleukin-1 receptor-like 2 isoform X2 n=1 Tax=Alligator sinensis TaxID=38654 RepID=A0A1U8DCW7_ALLSI|nr:interleukin-1 receptor-like 2 isoform X2 [Alligator sinensis]